MRHIAQHRANVNTKGGNFGYLDGIINGEQVDSKVFDSFTGNGYRYLAKDQP